MPFGEGQNIESTELARLRGLINPFPAADSSLLDDLDDPPQADRIEALERELEALRGKAGRSELLDLLGRSSEARAIRDGMGRCRG